MVANKLSERLDDEWTLTIVDQDETHYYQPGFLFIPFGIYSPDDVVKPKIEFLPPRADVVHGTIDLIEPADNRVKLADGTTLDYEYLVVATGARPVQPPLPGAHGIRYH